MLERHFQAQTINCIVNHPSVYPWIKGGHDDPFDLSLVVENKNNVFLVGEYGCVFFIKHQPSIYEFHTCVLPEGRGHWMMQGAEFAFHWMFTRTDAIELITKCPDGNISSKAGARAVGCSSMFRTGNIWPTDKGLVPVDVWSIILQNWMKTAPRLIEAGKKFHGDLEEKYKKFCKTENHSEDEVHDRYVGVCIAMILGGQPIKAINCYNRWAVMSGYKQISVLSLDPLVIDIQEARLRLGDNDFEVISCPQVAQTS